MEKINELCSKLFNRVSEGSVSKQDHTNLITWWIDELAKKIENIRSTSLNDHDASIRLNDLSEKTGLSLSTLWRFYDRD